MNNPRIDVFNEIVQDNVPQSLSGDLLEDILCLETLEGENVDGVDDLINDLNGDELSPEESRNFVQLIRPACTTTEVKQPELKPLPSTLKYAFLDSQELYPVIINASLNDNQLNSLLKVLREHRKAIGYTIDDLTGISPDFCMHRINLEEGHKPCIQGQRRLNPNMQEVVRKEVMKLLDAGIIYSVPDSKWVSPVQVVPKKGG